MNALTPYSDGLWALKSKLLYVIDVLKTSFVRCWCLKDVFCTLHRELKYVFYECLKCPIQLWIDFVMNVVLKLSFVRYGCHKDVFCTLWINTWFMLYNVLTMSNGCLGYVIKMLLKSCFTRIWSKLFIMVITNIFYFQIFPSIKDALVFSCFLNCAWDPPSLWTSWSLSLLLFLLLWFYKVWELMKRIKRMINLILR